MKIYNFKRILVCTDLTPSSDLVLRAAEQLRQRIDGEVDLLYVSELGFHFEEIATDSLKKTYREKILGDLKTSLEARMNDQLARTGLKARLLCKDGKVSQMLTAIADEGNHDLIVMGHGSKSIKQFILGSNAFKMISSGPLPLLIVKSELKLGRMTTLLDHTKPIEQLIIGAMDFFRSFRPASCEFVGVWLDFPPPFGHVNEQNGLEEKIVEVVRDFSRPDEQFEVKLHPTRNPQVAYPLNDILNQNHVDLVVMQRSGPRDNERFFVGSTTKRLTEIYTGNLLIFPVRSNMLKT